jgi:hypothetical protein
MKTSLANAFAEVSLYITKRSPMAIQNFLMAPPNFPNGQYETVPNGITKLPNGITKPS